MQRFDNDSLCLVPWVVLVILQEKLKDHVAALEFELRNAKSQVGLKKPRS